MMIIRLPAQWRFSSMMDYFRLRNDRANGERAKESEVVIDSTVQEKNVTYPLDTKHIERSSSGAGSWPIEAKCV